MNSIIKFAGVAIVACALTQSIQATPVTGNIGFTGGVTYDTSSAGTATEVTSWINPIVTLTSGVFATPSPFAVASGTPVSFTGSTWSFNSGAISSFWSVGGFTFNLVSSVIVSQQPGLNPGQTGYVVVSGTGMVSGNGFTPTVMDWSFTSQDPKAGSNPDSWTFSASANSVPDGGATVMLLGLALSAVALLKKKLTA
jgi:hypothetical protein